MSVPLAHALQDVELEAGKSYSCQVNGYWVELRVLGKGQEPSPFSISESDIMLDPWVELPSPQPIAIVRSTLGPPRLPDIPDIPTDEEET